MPLKTLLDQAGLSGPVGLLQLRGASGFVGVFTLAEAQEVLLATHAGGQVLEHWHGYPVRAVAPSRRGWFWVKWLSEVEVLAPSA